MSETKARSLMPELEGSPFHSFWSVVNISVQRGKSYSEDIRGCLVGRRRFHLDSKLRLRIGLGLLARMNSFLGRGMRR
jgi:hypothetical protein